MPDRAARRAIAAVHSRHFHVNISPQLLDLIADAAQGFNGDEIRAIFRDACTGLYCEDTPIQPDARRLGNLLGRIRHNIETRAAETAARRGAGGGMPPRG